VGSRRARGAGIFARYAIAPGGFRLVDGSASPAKSHHGPIATDTLSVMFHHPSGQLYRESLSVAGRDGTLAKNMTISKATSLPNPAISEACAR
jgi:D-alanyl-D-alanine carboxypeptidase